MIMTIKFSRDIYSKEALFKAAYYYCDKAYFHMDADKTYFYVCITPKDGETSIPYEQEFQNKAVEYMNRQIINQKTGHIREIIMARAFASTVILDDNEDSASSPETDEESAMKDWFDENRNS